MSSNLTEAHRRGGKPSKAETTVLIDNGETPSKPTVVRATVRRKFFGTGPFDQHWLIMDCCGLFCALITYSLHLYAVHVVCNILIPPWMSYKEEGEDEGTAIRHLTWMGVFHECAFVAIALLAIVSHFYAMTTDPGTVPPDAKPLEEEDEEKTLANGKIVKRLCRRCRAFKPQRAHHCSVCQRCIVKMDHHW
jgi:palmitoyltransferase